MTCAASGNTKHSYHFSGSCPRELWVLGSLDPHRRGKSQSKESVLVNDHAVDNRSMGEEAVPLENGEIRAKGADEWQNLRTCYSPKDFANTHLGLVLYLLAPHPAASRVDYDCGGDNDDDDAPSGLRNPSRRRFTPNFACFLNLPRSSGEEHRNSLKQGRTFPERRPPKVVIAASREPRRAASARTFCSLEDEGTAIGMKLETPKGKVEGQTSHAEWVGPQEIVVSRPIRNEAVIAANVEENGEEFEVSERSRVTLGKTGGVKSNCKAPETKGWSVAHSQLYLALTHLDLKAAAPMIMLTLLFRGERANMSTFNKGKGKEAMGEADYCCWCGRNATISGELTLGYATSKSDNEHGEDASGSNVWCCLERVEQMRARCIREMGNTHSCWKRLGYKFANRPKGATT
ncbi:hypothetical protein EDB87DRAFT_1579795 [Lactarius vividus]|nr:hypothetical protein EDB87DRAFT_1579795 [Lactarius vividus]